MTRDELLKEIAEFKASRSLCIALDDTEMECNRLAHGLTLYEDTIKALREGSPHIPEHLKETYRDLAERYQAEIEGLKS